MATAISPKAERLAAALEERLGDKPLTARELAAELVELPVELTQMLKKDRKLAKAFHALTPGRQRGYVMHFAAAKQAQTRTSRIEKCIPKILAGVGMNDR